MLAAFFMILEFLFPVSYAIALFSQSDASFQGKYAKGSSTMQSQIENDHQASTRVVRLFATWQDCSRVALIRVNFDPI